MRYIPQLILRFLGFQNPSLRSCWKKQTRMCQNPLPYYMFLLTCDLTDHNIKVCLFAIRSSDYIYKSAPSITLINYKIKGNLCRLILNFYI